MITFIYRDPHECINLLAIIHPLVVAEKFNLCCLHTYLLLIQASILLFLDSWRGWCEGEKVFFFFNLLQKIDLSSSLSILLRINFSIQERPLRFPTLMLYYGYMKRSLVISRQFYVSILFPRFDSSESMHLDSLFWLSLLPDSREEMDST